jgi:hypothetical protein
MGLVTVLLLGWFGLASMAFAAMQIWKYFDSSPRWGHSTPIIAICLAWPVLFLGGWLVFDILWAGNQVVSLIRRRCLKASQGNEST